MESLLQFLQCWSMVTWLTATVLQSPLPPACVEPDTLHGSATVETPIGQIHASAQVHVTRDGVTLDRPPTLKLWIDNYAAYSNSRRNAPTVVGHSRQIALSHDEAAARAHEDAARQLYDRMRHHLHRWLRDGDERQWIVKSIASDLAAGKYVLDTYSSSNRRRLGEFWNYSVLVDASDRRLQSMADKYNIILRERKIHFGRTVASVAGLVLFIVLTYAGVNAWTKGYFRARLRAAAFMVGIAGTSLLIWLAKLAP